MSSTPKQHARSWADHGRQGFQGSLAVAEEEALLDEDGDDSSGGRAIPRRDRRRSSTASRLAAVVDFGGPNSFRSFARSWQRAAAFAEVIPRRPSFVYAADQEPVDDSTIEDIQYSRSYNNERVHPPRTGLLRQHLESSSMPTTASSSHQGLPDSDAVHSSLGDLQGDDFRARESKQLDAEIAANPFPAHSLSTRSSIFANPPFLATPSIISSSHDSYHSSQYGTVARRVSIGRVVSRDQTIGTGDGADDDDDFALGEDHPILVKEVKKGSKIMLAVEGQSTLPQSVFNSINAIIGVGLLSLPLALKMSGWIIGLSLLTLTAAVTAHTAKLLGKCMKYDTSLITYSDLAFISFGTKARIIVSALFTLELVAACVALVILFADSIDLLFPGLLSVTLWKCACAVLILVLSLMPLRWLSYTSIVGIFSTFCIVCIVVVDGLLKKEAPGSLLDPAKTHLLPTNWLALPLAYGLLASPWGAHSVFPSIYRDMRHPRKWDRGVDITFGFSYTLDMGLAIIGLIMFGDGIREAITSNILKTSDYPRPLSILMCIFVAIIPLTKIPLNARPLITTADVIFGLHEDHHYHPGVRRRTDNATAFLKGLVRVCVVLILLAISVLFPAFDSVCAFLGAALCTLISVVLPISFYLKLFWEEVSVRERAISLLLLTAFSILGFMGTVWTFLPRHVIGAS